MEKFMNQNIKWYSDKNLSIYFSEMPLVSVRYLSPQMTDEEKKSIRRYPFIIRNELKVTIFDSKKNKSYKFMIPKGYCYDGASIPRMFWRVIGANTDNSFLISSLVHDVLCENHEYIDNDRSLSTNVFNALLCASNVGCFKRFFMKNSVACYQSVVCHW